MGLQIVVAKVNQIQLLSLMKNLIVCLAWSSVMNKYLKILNHKQNRATEKGNKM